MATNQPTEDYRKTALYRDAPPALRRQYERWTQEQKLDGERMCLELSLLQLRQMPKEERRRGNRAAEALVIASMLFFLAVANARSKATLLIACGLLFVNTLLYLTGVLNPYVVQTRRLKKRLRAYPQIEPFEAWQARQEPEKDQKKPEDRQ